MSGLGSRNAAAILSVVSLAALVWTIALIRSLKRLPVLVDSAGVTMRVGSLKAVLVPLEQVAGVRTTWPSDALKPRTGDGHGAIGAAIRFDPRREDHMHVRVSRVAMLGCDPRRQAANVPFELPHG